jgi:hypothetical protein
MPSTIYSMMEKGWISQFINDAKLSYWKHDRETISYRMLYTSKSLQDNSFQQLVGALPASSLSDNPVPGRK